MSWALDRVLSAVDERTSQPLLAGQASTLRDGPGSADCERRATRNAATVQYAGTWRARSAAQRSLLPILPHAEHLRHSKDLATALCPQSSYSMQHHQRLVRSAHPRHHIGFSAALAMSEEDSKWGIKLTGSPYQPKRLIHEPSAAHSDPSCRKYQAACNPDDAYQLLFVRWVVYDFAEVRHTHQPRRSKLPLSYKSAFCRRQKHCDRREARRRVVSVLGQLPYRYDHIHH